MSYLYNDNLDDPLAMDACLTFTGGQVSNVRANLLAPEQYAEGVNVDIDRFGAVVTRRGTDTQLGTVPGPDEDDWESIAVNWESHGLYWNNAAGIIRGLAYYDKPGTEEMFAVADGILYKSTGSTWASVSGFTPTSTNNVDFAQLVDKLYMTQGTGNVFSYNGTTVTDEGSGATDPPTCKYLVTHTNRLFAAGLTVPDSLACSDLLDGGTWDATNDVIRIGGGDGDPIKGIQPWYDHLLLVFKERSIFAVNTDPTATSAANWIVNNIDRNIGCVSHRTITQVGSDVFFLAPDGIRTVKTILQGAQQAISEPISVGVQDVIDDINWTAAIDQASAIFFENHYLLSVPTGDSEVNNTLVVFNTITRSFVGKWTGWNAESFAISAFSGLTKLNAATSDGTVLTWLHYVQDSNEADSTYQDAGSDYISSVLTRGLTFGEPFNEVQPQHVEVELKPALSTTVELKPIFDSVTEGTRLNTSNIDTKISKVLLPQVLPFTLPVERAIINSYNMMMRGPCREVQFKVSSTSNKMHLRAIRGSAFVNTMVLENE